MPTTGVCIVEEAPTSNSPRIDLSLKYNSDAAIWPRIDSVIFGRLPASDYEPVRLVVRHKLAEDWDYYSGPCMGLLSKRAADVLRPYCGRCFELLDAQINDSPYYFLRIVGRLDCLDRENSILVPFPSDPTDIMDIERYRFRKDAIPDPILFAIKEGPALIFGSDTVARVIQCSALKGIRIRDAEADQYP